MRIGQFCRPNCFEEEGEEEEEEWFSRKLRTAKELVVSRISRQAGAFAGVKENLIYSSPSRQTLLNKFSQKLRFLLLTGRGAGIAGIASSRAAVSDCGSSRGLRESSAGLGNSLAKHGNGRKGAYVW